MDLIVWTGTAKFDKKGKYIIKNQFCSDAFRCIQIRSDAFD